MVSRLPQKCFGATQRCPPPPKNVTFHPRMFGCHPKIVLLHPKMFWVHPKRFGAPQLFFACPENVLRLRGSGAGFSKRTHHDGIATPKMREFRIERDVSEGLSSLAGNDSVRLRN